MKSNRLICLFLSFFLAFLGVFDANSHSAHAEDNCSVPLDLSPLSGFFFLGESTTSHLKSRSPLPAEQVLTNESGTMKLDSTLLSRPVTDPKSGEHIKISDVLSRYQPKGIFLSFGLNGILAFDANPPTFTENYRKLIQAVKESAPSAEIYVQAIYPVARDEYQADWPFSRSPQEINKMILRLNALLPSLCEETEVKFADAASFLRDGEGYLRSDYTTDGIHLTESAYDQILRALIQCVGKDIHS
jgi:lysophospholipase L1-like esterase